MATNYKVNGKEYFRVSASFGRDSDGKLIRKFFYGKTKSEAKRKMEEYKFNLKRGVDINKKTLLSDSMKEWLYEIVKAGIKLSTFDRYEDIFRNYIQKSTLSNKDIKDIKAIDMQKYYNSLYENGKSYTRIRSINRLVKRFFSYAFSEGLILRNPCENVIIPGKLDYKKEDIEVFTKDELSKILHAKENSMIKNLAIIAFSTGMRIGEILGLDESAIDESKGLIHIKQIVACYTQIEPDGSRHKVKKLQTPKTNNSCRDIPYPKELKSVFANELRRRAGNKLRFGDMYNSEFFDKKIIFLTDEGNLVYHSNIERSWRLFLKRLDIPYRKFHSLRHTYATMQFQANIPLKTVSELLGHSNIQITANTYTHVLKEDMDKSVSIINVLNMC